MYRRIFQGMQAYINKQRKLLVKRSFLEDYKNKRSKSVVEKKQRSVENVVTNFITY